MNGIRIAKKNRVHIVGFGGQGRAWAPSLKEAGFEAPIYLRDQSPSFEVASKLALNALPLSSLPQELAPGDAIVMACPDRKIGEVYRDVVAPIQTELHIILIHGYAVWSNDLRIHETGANAGRSEANLNHTVNLIAPKAIGPELRAAIQVAQTRNTATPLKAGYSATQASAQAACIAIATEGLKFDVQNLIPATFAQETVGDLISEQLLLCGGLFSLLEFTYQEMRKAGIPERLIHEECITELELIARVLRALGLPGTLLAISDSAKAGAVMMRERLIAHGLPKVLHAQAQEVIDQKFLSRLLQDQDWKKKLEGAFKI